VITFTVDGRVVGTTRATKQATIRRLMLRLAEQHTGKEVVAHYPVPHVSTEQFEVG
jgi:hypothetical protein